MQGVLGKLYDVLTMGDDNVAQSNDDFFSWCTPGIPYDEDQFDFLTQGFTAMIRKNGQSQGGENSEDDGSVSLKEKMGMQTAELYQEAENLARFVDFIPGASGLEDSKRRQNLLVWNPDATLSGMYEYVLRMSQVIKSELDEKTKAKIEKLRGLLVTTKTKVDLITDEEFEVTEPSMLVKLYYEKMNAYIEAAMEYRSYQVSAMAASTPEAVHFWAMNASKLRNRVRAAYNDWVANGYKEDFDKINAYLDQVMSRDLTLLKKEYKEDLDNAVLTGIASNSDFYYTSLLPGNFARAKGWTKFTFTQQDYESHYQQDQTNWGAQASFLGSVLNIGGKVDSSTTKVSSDIDWSTFSLSFEMAQVPISRPWFHAEFLKSHYWRFHPDASKTGQTDVLSDGKLPPAGGLPAYAAAMIAVRNVVFNFKTHSGNYDAVNKAISGGGGLSIGPFFAGGKYKNGHQERDFQSSTESQGIEVPGMQVVGFRCHLLPKSPDPVKEIKDDQWV